MNAQSSGEMARFHQFVADQIERRGEAISPEQVLDLWRESNPVPDDYEETVLALREALADVAAGEPGIPLAEFDRRFRAKQRPTE